MMKMRDGIWVAAGLITALLIGETAMRVVETAVPPPSRWPSAETQIKDGQLAKLAREVEVVFIGSSVTEAAVDPELLNALAGTETVYNAALPFSSPLSDEVWLAGVVLDHIDPSIVVMGVPAWPAHGNVDSDPLRRAIQHAIAPAPMDWFSRKLALIGNKGVLSDWDERSVRHGLSTSESWTDFGHQTGYYDRAPQSLIGRFPPFGDPQMSPDNVHAFTETVTTLQRADIEVVLMIEPGQFPGEVSDADIDLYLTSIRELGRELGVQVWDTYTRGWDPDFYVDEAHFNRKGTVAFTTYLADLVGDLAHG
jgi:hypothetical protein